MEELSKVVLVGAGMPPPGERQRKSSTYEASEGFKITLRDDMMVSIEKDGDENLVHASRCDWMVKVKAKPAKKPAKGEGAT